LEMVQVAQVYIIDTELRKQLEAEVRNDIRARSDQSNIRTAEETRLAQLASDRRIQEQKLVSDKAAVRQMEELELANLQYQLRIQKENQEVARETILMGTEKFKLEQDSQRQKVEIEAPNRLFQIEKERAVKENQLELLEVENRVRGLEVMRDTALEKARQDLRKEILPVEQTPAIAESLSRIFQGADLTYFGSNNPVLESILPIFDVLSNMVSQKLAGNGGSEKPVQESKE
jgi:hypothetical protein